MDYYLEKAVAGHIFFYYSCIELRKVHNKRIWTTDISECHEREKSCVNKYSSPSRPSFYDKRIWTTDISECHEREKSCINKYSSPSRPSFYDKRIWTTDMSECHERGKACFCTYSSPSRPSCIQALLLKRRGWSQIFFSTVKATSGDFLVIRSCKDTSMTTKNVNPGKGGALQKLRVDLSHSVYLPSI